ncbi:hypothetical protein PthstB1num2_16700 [Parageobacillus thermoglucosidasius]|uniref:Uncharacterized protein n=1 Tax=Geobacillus sp. (strain Y4.1MC1) TaxID=581103 RepID=A0A7U4DLU6_GEOS0|nr:hypothetical protein Geoth_3231 [Parageobacillus thermoglucosidasius C56-YS93]GCD83934.1 hypothetical protein PTHTG4_29990 [Parageobacillus thermoglucosidasius]GMN99630.1 hypothetical protein PthstB1num2_16700 [Parageobacillus thermoglucosidasius]
MVTKSIKFEGEVAFSAVEPEAFRREGSHSAC